MELGCLGLGDAAIYFIGRNRKNLPVVFGTLLVTVAALSSLLVGCGWLLLQYGRPELYDRFPLWMWIIIALLVPIHLLEVFLMQLLSAILRIREINIVDVTRATVQLSLFALLVIVMGAGFTGAFIAYALSTCYAAITFLLLLLYYGGRPKWPDWALLLDSLRYGLKAYFSGLLGFLTLRLDALLVASLAINGVQAAGVYSVATSLAELLLFIPTSIRLSLFPMVSGGSTAQANLLTSAAWRHTLLLTMILGLGLGAVGPLAIARLYGEGFASALIPLMILLPGVMMLAQSVIFFGDLNGRGRPGAALVGTLFSLIVTVVLDFVLIPQYGIIGAALASSAAYTVQLVIAVLFFIHHSGLSWQQLFIFQKSDFDGYLSILPSIRKMVQAVR
jgi:stage V sporulation protein B